MPPLYIEFMPGTLDKKASRKLKKTLRRDTAERFSVPERHLTEDDMTVIFTALHEWSEPTHDIVVRMQLHNDQARLDKAESDAEEMAQVIAAALKDSFGESEVTIGVALGYFPIEWATAELPRGNHDKTDR